MFYSIIALILSLFPPSFTILSYVFFSGQHAAMDAIKPFNCILYILVTNEHLLLSWKDLMEHE